MESLKLSNKSTNELFKLIRESGLNPTDFKWTDDRDKSVPSLRYGNEESFFVFKWDNIHSVWDIHYYLSDHTQVLAKTTHYNCSWAEVLVWFSAWLDNLKGEFLEPDLWSQLTSKQLPHETTELIGISNEPFTPSEIEQIKLGLNQVRAYIEEHIQTSAEQYEIIIGELDYLVEEAKHQGRKNWRNISIAVIFTIISMLQLDPEQSKTIWSLIDNALRVIQLLP